MADTEPLQDLEQYVDENNRHWVPLRDAAAALKAAEARAEIAERDYDCAGQRHRAEKAEADLAAAREEIASLTRQLEY